MKPSRAGLQMLIAVTRGHRPSILIALAFVLAAAGISLIQPLVAAHVVAAATTGRSPIRLASMLALLFVAYTLLDGIARYALERSGERVVLDLRLSLVDHLLRLSLRAHECQRLGDLLARAAVDTSVVRDMTIRSIVELLSSIVLIVGGLVMMATLDPVLFLIVLMTVVPPMAIIPAVVSRIRHTAECTQTAVGAMSAELERALSAIRTVRAMQAESYERDRIGACVRSAYLHSIRTARLEALLAPAGTLAVHGSLVAVLVVGGARVASGSTQIGDLVGFVLYFTYVAVPMMTVFDVAGLLQRGLAALQRIYDVRSLPTEELTRQPPSAPVSRGPTSNHVPALEFRQVWFQYQDGRPLLRGVSFQVRHGSCVALIGASGAGKSTIFALVERFYEPSSGKILLHGKDMLSELTIEQCRAQVGLVEQHAPLLHGSLLDNIAYPRSGASYEEVRRVLKLADLDDLVRRLPDGLEAQVGDHGANLSGGERQRISIARALLRRPRVLLLDEPTSQLDAISEAALRRTLAEVAKECALLVIAHRPSTIELADEVILLDEGRAARARNGDAVLDDRAVSS